MEFRKCSIEGISYGGDVNAIVRVASHIMNINIENYRFNLDGEDFEPRDSIEMHEICPDQDNEVKNSIFDDAKTMRNLGSESWLYVIQVYQSKMEKKQEAINSNMKQNLPKK
ncbi:unnamed protein product [Lactuca virosa]|uniref:Uncharacterized protein n=1 Tax=Lactuca virosa TaxID=75947 RepID=A0AAU9NVY8_9ASTR|nr:unnamed protein product [Lactuca virosa]